MATHLVELPDSDGENVFQGVRREIEELFHSLIEKVNERREVLLTQLNQWEEEFNRTRASCIQSLEEIKRERTEMEQFLATLKINQARTSMEKGISDLNNEISEEEQKLHYPQVQFVCDRNDLNSKISKFGSLKKEIFDLNLRFKRIIANPAIVNSYCLRVRNNTIYIVESTGVIKLFSKTDQLLKTIPKLPLLSDDICHFNFDSQLNFLITDYRNNSLFILSPEGDLIHSVYFTEFGLTSPCGINIVRDGSIVLSFQNDSKAIAIF